MKKTINVVCSLIALIMISGCGGSSSGGGGDNGEITGAKMKGYVADGPIDGAVVTLYDNSGKKAELCKKGVCETKTSKGFFEFEFSNNEKIASLFSKGYYIQSSGGVDTELGNMPALSMRTALDLYSANSSQLNLNPLTTMVSIYMEKSGETDIELAKNKISSLTNVLASDIGAVPEAGSANDKILKVLTYLADISGNGFQSEGFLYQVFDAEGNLDTSVGSAFDHLVSDELKEEAKTAVKAIMESENCSLIFKKITAERLLFNCLTEIFDNDEVDNDFSVNIEIYRKNSCLLAEKLLAHENFSLENSSVYKSVKFILSAYGLYSDSDQGVENRIGRDELLPLDLVRKSAEGDISLENDKDLGIILKDSVRYYVKNSLLKSELPGNDNFKRAEYYFSSDISHLYKAESVIGHVLDDEINDSINENIVKSYADNGFFEKAAEIIKLRMYRTQNIGDSWLHMGNAYLKHGIDDKGIEALAKAEESYRRIITSKGEANVDAQDSSNIQVLSSLYRNYGYEQLSNDLLTYLDKIISAIQDADPTTFGRLAVALHFLVEDYIEKGDLNQAESVADIFYKMAKLAPDKNGTYKTRVFYLSWAVSDFANLNNKAKALDAYNKFRETRNINEDTYNGTWFYMESAANGLAALNLENELEELLAEVFDENSGASAFVKDGLKGLYIAAEGLKDVDSGLAKMNELYAEDKIIGKIEALTYPGINPATSYLAPRLISAGENEKALKVLKKVEEMIDSLYKDLTDVSDEDFYTNKIERGYLKVSGLYKAAGYASEAQNAAYKALNLFDKFKGYMYKIYAMANTAAVLSSLGIEGEAENLLNDCLVLLDYSADPDPSDWEEASENALICRKIIDRWNEISKPKKALNAIEKLIAHSEKIFDEEKDDPANPGKDREKQIEAAVRSYVKAGLYYVSAGEYSKAYDVLAKAEKEALFFNDKETMYEMFTGESGTTFEGIVMGYVQSNRVDKALELADTIPLYSYKKEALLDIAGAFGSMDRFPAQNPVTRKIDHLEWWVATVDTDGDGRPDFFSPLASEADIAASGLELDDDCDGDGILGTEDLRPFYKD
ncbi:MAG: hypothetical protein RBR08_09845 [Desulforegulaceae bacterium]|nr:hypothetical protein [Desulforegulaceae bacterium]